MNIERPTSNIEVFEMGIASSATSFDAIAEKIGDDAVVGDGITARFVAIAAEIVGFAESCVGFAGPCVGFAEPFDWCAKNCESIT